MRYERSLDVIPYGATGFTGLVAKYLINRNNGADSFCWAIAGRSKAKLGTLHNLARSRRALARGGTGLRTSSGRGYAEYVVGNPRHVPVNPGGDRYGFSSRTSRNRFPGIQQRLQSVGLKVDETLLVHGTASVIGVTAIQMAKAAYANVIATAQGEEKARAALALDANAVVEVTSNNFVDVANSAGGVDVWLDVTVGLYVARNLVCLKTAGRIAYIAPPGGNEIRFSISEIMRKRDITTGSTLRAKYGDNKAEIIEAIEHIVWVWIVDGRFISVVDRSFPLSKAAAAHTYLKVGTNVGKVVVDLQQQNYRRLRL